MDDGSFRAERKGLGIYTFRSSEPAAALFCENETNVTRLFGKDGTGPFKDAFHDYVIRGIEGSVGAAGVGTKAAYYRRITVPAGGSAAFDLEDA